MRGRLEGTTALVTGAGSGIGRATADRFSAEGARVVAVDRDGDRARAAAGDRDGTRAEEVDISDERAVAELFRRLADDGWAPGVVVANAGVQLFGRDDRIAELELDVWRTTIDINLTGTFLTLKHAVRSMLTTGGGSIVVTGSPTGLRGEGSDFTAYATSKAGVHGLARSVAAAYARDGIRVNTVVPGYTETSLVTTISGDPAARSAIVGRIPLGRPGTAADVVGAMVFLASPESAYATGGLYTVDGGMSTL